MMSVMAPDSVTSLKDMTNTCKLMRNSPTIAGFLLCNGGELKEAEDFKCVSSFIVCLNQNRSALVRELLSNNIHCLSISCRKIDNLHCPPMI